MRKTIGLIIIGAFVLFSGCASSLTHKVAYPPADELFVTVGDDPGSESVKAYTPKGLIIHIEREAYFPFPVLGIFIKFGNADPQYVFDTKVIPQVRAMGGDAIIGSYVQYTPPGPWFLGLYGLRTGALTIIGGQVVKR